MNINQFGYFFDEDIRLIDESYVKISLQLRFFFSYLLSFTRDELTKGRKSIVFIFFSRFPPLIRYLTLALEFVVLRARPHLVNELFVPTAYFVEKEKNNSFFFFFLVKSN